MRMLTFVVALAATLAGVENASAQAWPSRPITLIVPYSAGGPTDTLGRILAEHMRTSIGQTIIVENVTGAGGTIGVGRVARAGALRHPLLMHNITFPLSSVAQARAKRLPFDAEKDFACLSIAVYLPFVLTSHPSVPAKDLRELGAFDIPKILNSDTKTAHIPVIAMGDGGDQALMDAFRAGCADYVDRRLGPERKDCRGVQVGRENDE